MIISSELLHNIEGSTQTFLQLFMRTQVQGAEIQYPGHVLLQKYYTTPLP